MTPSRESVENSVEKILEIDSKDLTKLHAIFVAFVVKNIGSGKLVFLRNCSYNCGGTGASLSDYNLRT